MYGEQRTRTLLGRFDPARDVAVPPARLSAADLIERAESSAVPELGHRRGRVSARPTRRLVLVAAGLAVVAGTAVAVHPRDDVGDPEPRTDLGPVLKPMSYQLAADPPPAAAALRELAGRITDADCDTRRGSYTYHHEKSWGGLQQRSAEGYLLSYVEDVERWVKADGSGRQRSRMLPPEFPDEASRRYYARVLKDDMSTAPHDTELPAGSPAGPLPSDRAALADRLNARYGPGSVAKALTTMYSEYAVPRPIRATILEILAGVPGFAWRGQVTDRAGRPGSAITGEDHGQQSVLVFDPHTGELLAYEMVTVAAPHQVRVYELHLGCDRTDRLG
jgi:hypothetical protein